MKNIVLRVLLFLGIIIAIPSKAIKLSEFILDKDSVCPNESVQFTHLNLAAISYAWDFGDGSPLVYTSDPKHTYAYNGTFTVMFIAVDFTGNKDTSYKSIFVNQPNPYVYMDKYTVCPGEPITCTDYDYSFSYHRKWIFSNGDTLISKGFQNNIKHSISTPGTHSVTVFSEYKGCSTSGGPYQFNVDTTNKPLLFTGNYDINFGENLACTNRPLNFSFYNNQNSFKYAHWFFGDGADEKDTLIDGTAIKHAYSSATNYDIILKAYNYCNTYDSAILPIDILDTHTDTINPSDVYVSPVTFCPNTDASFVFMNNMGKFVSCTWYFGDTNTSTEFSDTHSYSTAKTYNVNLVATNYCGNIDQYNLQISVDTTIRPSLQLHTYNIYTPSTNKTAKSDTVCPGTPLKFVLDSALYSDHKFFWNMGDGNILSGAEVNYVFNSTGTYVVYCRITNKCGLSDSGLVTVFVGNAVKPSPEIWVSHSDTVCPGDLVRFEGNGATSFDWFMGDGTHIKNKKVVYHKYNTVKTYSVTMVATNNCALIDTAKTQVITGLKGIPENVETLTSSRHACLKDTLTFAALQPFSSYRWEFGDGDTATTQIAKHAYNKTSTANAPFVPSLTVTNQCGEKKKISLTDRSIVIQGSGISPETDFSINGSLCQNTPISFLPKVSVINGLSWNFGDGNMSSEILARHSYPAPGNYQVVLKITNNCMLTDSTIRIISIDTGAVIKGDVKVGPLNVDGYAKLFKKPDAGKKMILADSVKVQAGYFEFTGVGEGEYRILAVDEFPLINKSVGTFFGDVPRWDSAQTIKVVCGDSLFTANIKMLKLLTIAPGKGKIKGRITADSSFKWGWGIVDERDPLDHFLRATGKGIPNITIGIIKPPGTQVQSIEETDSAGYYEFNNIPDGTYNIWVDIPGMPMDSTYEIVVDVNDTTFYEKNFHCDSLAIWIDSTKHDPNSISKKALLQTAQVYPNPTQGQLTIDIASGGTDIISVSIFNLLGEQVYLNTLQSKQHKLSINLKAAGLLPGVYLLKLTDSQGNTFNDKILLTDY